MADTDEIVRLRLLRAIRDLGVYFGWRHSRTLVHTAVPTLMGRRGSLGRIHGVSFAEEVRG
jgi:hypothetical protein